MNINKEAIYDTRPWVVFGEGPIAEEDIPLNAQGFNEGSYSQAGAKEIRFTQTPKYLYATVLAWPADGKVNIKSLAADSKLMRERFVRWNYWDTVKSILSVPPKACRLRFLHSR